MRNYLEDRVVVSSGDDDFEWRVGSGVPQGSVLGPLLWNVGYDDVLRLPGLPCGVELFAYADDLAILVSASSSELLQLRVNVTVREISRWMNGVGLALAPAKCEALFLTGRMLKPECTFWCNGITIPQVRQARYLGVILDSCLSGTRHIAAAVDKASKAANEIARILPNLGGATVERRRLLMAVAESIALFGAAVWPVACHGYLKTRNGLRKAQRPAALRVICAYRTVSTSAALVLVGDLPWDLLANLRHKRWIDPTITWEEAESEARQAWQTEWDSVSEGESGWQVRRLIPSIEGWQKRAGGNLDFFTTQFITGHGDFGAYLHRIGRVETPICQYCDSGEVDDAEHTLLRCIVWTEQREAFGTGSPPSSLEEVVRVIHLSRDSWDSFSEVARRILRAKMERGRALLGGSREVVLGNTAHSATVAEVTM